MYSDVDATETYTAFRPVCTVYTHLHTYNAFEKYAAVYYVWSSSRCILRAHATEWKHNVAETWTNAKVTTPVPFEAGAVHVSVIDDFMLRFVWVTAEPYSATGTRCQYISLTMHQKHVIRYQWRRQDLKVGGGQELGVWS